MLDLKDSHFVMLKIGCFVGIHRKRLVKHLKRTNEGLIVLALIFPFPYNRAISVSFPISIQIISKRQ